MVLGHGALRGTRSTDVVVPRSGRGPQTLPARIPLLGTSPFSISSDSDTPRPTKSPDNPRIPPRTG